tara:strand:- start:354 stop:536 length:183 start_codon:yes stop_codon:yes gene_type:complete
MNFTQKELLDIYQALLCYRTDMTIIDPINKPNGLTDDEKAFYQRLSDLMEKVSVFRRSLQ